MSRVLIQRLAAIQQEFEASRAALTYVERQWPQATEDVSLKGVSRTQIVLAIRKLEQTYLTRLFSEFEGMLKTYLENRRETVPGRAFDLINKVAVRRRANVPDDKRDAVHLVREYRNAVVHAQDSGIVAVSFRQALSALNQYLVSLPDP